MRRCACSGIAERLLGGPRRSGLARAGRRLDGERDAAPARLGLGAADRGAARAARARRADAVLAAEAMGRSRRTRRRRAPCWSIPPMRGEARPADRPGRGARRAERDGRGRRPRCSRPSAAKDAPNLLLAEAGHRDRQDARLSRAGGAVGGAVGRDGVGLDLHQGAAAPARRRGAQAVRRRRGARAADRRPQGPRELPVPAQSRGRAAGRVCRPRRDPRPAGRALGGLHQGRRHGRRRLARLAAEPVPPRRGGRADRPPRRMRLCRLPALPPLLHRARRAGEPRGGHRHRQPCAGDGQRRARARGRAGADPVRRGPSSVRCRRIRPSRSPSAGRKRSSCGAGSSGRRAARAGGGAGLRRG